MKLGPLRRGQITGNGTCNRYAGPSTIEGASLKFGALISTKMACVDTNGGTDLNGQESAFFQALAATERAEITPAGRLEFTQSGGAPTRLRPATP